jgi:CheY-like chemotaxis protein
MPKPRRILLAEDDPHDAELTLRALRAFDLADLVDVVADGEQALDYLYRRGAYAQRPAGDPAVALLDIKMPKVEGIEVLRTIKSDARLRSIPCVMFTSSREAGDVRASYELGSNAYVVKPVEYAEFRAAIEALGAFWAQVNEPPPA